jgi:hypothetical protein
MKISSNNFILNKKNIFYLFIIFAFNGFNNESLAESIAENCFIGDNMACNTLYSNCNMGDSNSCNELASILCQKGDQSACNYLNNMQVTEQDLSHDNQENDYNSYQDSQVNGSTPYKGNNADCTSEWISCNKICRSAITLDRQDIDRQKDCSSECDNDKRRCESSSR